MRVDGPTCKRRLQSLPPRVRPQAGKGWNLRLHVYETIGRARQLPEIRSIAVACNLSDCTSVMYRPARNHLETANR